LNRHRDIAIPLESLFIVDYLRAAGRFDLQTMLGYLVDEPEIKEWGIEPSVSDLEECQTIGEAIARLHEIYAGHFGKSAWGQKTPRFIRHLPLLQMHFPAIRVVHVVRDPRAVVNSLMQSDVHRSDAYHAARRWRMDVSEGLAFENAHPGVVLRVTYEDLVRSPAKVLDRIVGFLGFGPAWLDRSTESEGASEYSAFYENIHANLDRPPSTEFVEKWKAELSPRDVEIAELVCTDLMLQLGYSPQNEEPNPGTWTLRRVKLLRLARMPLQVGRYLRHRRNYLIHLLWRKWKLGMLREFLWEINY
jgi:hypothetical protein